MDLSGIFPALTTPFSEDGGVTLSGLKQNIRRYNSMGLSGYVVLGSTGESVLLSRTEADRILETVKENAAKGNLLIAGTGAESTAETIERTKRAAELGYEIALVKTPYYYKPAYKPDVLVAHFRRVADASRIPVLLYSVPQFTGVTLETPEIVALAEHPNVLGIKDSSGHVQRISEVMGLARSSFQILTGGAPVVLPALSVGARGAILALASALPEKCVALYQFFRQGEWEKAREVQIALARASRTMVSESGIAGVKFVMDQRGYHGGLPRLPLQPLSERSKQSILEMLVTLEPAKARA